MGKHLHPDPRGAGKSLEQQSGVPVGKVPGGASNQRVRLQFATRKSPTFSTRLQADSNQPLCKSAALVVVINALVLARKSWNVLDPREPSRPSRCKESHDLLSIVSSGLRYVLAPSLAGLGVAQPFGMQPALASLSRQREA